MPSFVDELGRCSEGRPLAVHCATTDGTPWQKAAQQLLVPCTLDGIVCVNVQNPSTGCRDYRIQLYCARPPTNTAAEPSDDRSAVSLLARRDEHGKLVGDRRTDSPTAVPTVERTFAPVDPPTAVPVKQWGGTAALDGRGLCDVGTDSCAIACSTGMCKCSAGWFGDECGTRALKGELLSARTDEAGNADAEVLVRAEVTPSAAVTCDVVSAREDECVAIERAIVLNGSSIVSAAIRGVKDFVDDGDQRVRVSVGGCRSLDYHFDGADVGSWDVTNAHVAFPSVDVVEPMTAHVKTGRKITVLGSLFKRGSTVRVGKFEDLRFDQVVLDWRPQTDIVMAYIVMAYIVMAYIVMAYIVMARQVVSDWRPQTERAWTWVWSEEFGLTMLATVHIIVD